MQNIINIYQFIIISLGNSVSGASTETFSICAHSMATIHKMSACNLVNPDHEHTDQMKAHCCNQKKELLLHIDNFMFGLNH